MTAYTARKHLAIHRAAFLIVGPDGLIKKIWLQVKPEEHEAELLAAL